MRSLSMLFFWDSREVGDGWTIGSLRRFSELTHLSVPGKVLLGQLSTWASYITVLGIRLTSGAEKFAIAPVCDRIDSESSRRTGELCKG